MKINFLEKKNAFFSPLLLPAYLASIRVFHSRDWNEVLQLPFEWLISNCHLFSCNFHLSNEREDEEDKSRNFFTGSLRK